MSIIRTSAFVACAACCGALSRDAAAGDLVVLHAPQSHSSFGMAVRGAGDVNADGLADVVVGAFRDATAGQLAGAARVYDGEGHLLLAVFGSTGNELGTAVAGAGDIDGDGHDDLIVSAPRFDGAFTNSGRALLISGADGHVLRIFDGPGPSDPLFGADVAGVGDVDADGVPDVAVGASNDASQGTNLGSARVYSGATGQLLHVWFGADSNSQMGAAIAGAGDVDGDGHADVVAGALNGDSFSLQDGRVTLFSGATGSVLQTWAGALREHLGASVDGGMDVDGDGVPDVLAGAPKADTVNGLDSGRMLLFSGADGTQLAEWLGDGYANGLGKSVAFAGDLDGDGTPDVLGAAKDAPLWSNFVGTVSAWSGADGSLIFERAGHGDTFFFGAQVDGVGDTNGDGRADLVIGEPNGSQTTPFGEGSVLLADGFGGRITRYGSGCHGCLFDPELHLYGSASPGDEQLLMFTHADCSTLALLFLGLQPVSVPLKGCTLLVDPPLAGIPVIPPLGQGTFVLKGELPPAASGAVVVMQAWLIVPEYQPGQLAATNGVQLVFP